MIQKPLSRIIYIYIYIYLAIKGRSEGCNILGELFLQGRRYKLVSTITHHGKEASKGHYTADARYHDDQWLRFDDASVTAIGTSKVLHDQAYVLFYRQL